MSKLSEEKKLEICLSCGCYDKKREPIFGKTSGNCDIEDFLDCKKHENFIKCLNK